jgi:hypothetical protein
VPCGAPFGGSPIPTGSQAGATMAYVPPKLPSTRAATPSSKPVVRAQSDDTAPHTIRIPTPEELGLGGSGDEPLDWATVERRLDAAGATAYQVEKTSTGFRFTCQLPSGSVSGRGATKPQAVRQALAQLTH